jgi:hypothetical protein
VQQAHMYSDTIHQASEHQAHMQRAQFAAQSRYHQQQRSAYAETGEYPFFPLPSARPYPGPDHEVDMLQVPESDDDGRTRRSSSYQKDAEDQTESMRDKLARMQTMSGGKGDRSEQQSRRSSQRNGETPYRAGESRRDHRDRHRPEPSLFSRRGGESSHRQSESRRENGSYRPSSSRRDAGSSYRLSSPRHDGDGESSHHASRTSQTTHRGSDHDLSDYRAETAAFPPTLGSARPSSSRSSAYSSQQRPGAYVGRPSYDGRGISREYVTASRDYYREQGRNYRPEGRTHAQMYSYGEHGEGPSRPSGRPRY